MSLGADHLHHRCADARVRCEPLDEMADANNLCIAVRGIEDAPLAHDIVDDDDAAATRQLHGPVEIGGNVGSIGIYEYEIERLFASNRELRKAVERRTNADLDAIRQARPRQIRTRNVHVLRIEFECDDTAVWRYGARKPNGAIAGQRSDLEDSFGTLRSRDEMEQLAVRGCHAH